MRQMLLNASAVVVLLILMSVSLAVRFKLLSGHQQILRKSEEEQKSVGSLLVTLVRDTLLMK